MSVVERAVSCLPILSSLIFRVSRAYRLCCILVRASDQGSYTGITGVHLQHQMFARHLSDLLAGHAGTVVTRSFQRVSGRGHQLRRFLRSTHAFVFLTTRLSFSVILSSLLIPVAFAARTKVTSQSPASMDLCCGTACNQRKSSREALLASSGK